MTSGFPVVVDGYGADPVDWLRTHRADVDAALDSSGALLMRAFAVTSPSDCAQIAAAFSGDVLDYTYRSTPRISIGARIFTATDYPAGLCLALHNENAYQRQWPLHILFCCLKPADTGGQTPIGSNIRITKRIDVRIRQRFLSRGVMYIRNYRADLDLPWQEVFQTQSRSDVESYCAAHDIACEWRPDGALRTAQVCQGMARHPRTGNIVWFNSAHMFHPSGLDARTERALRDAVAEEDWPRNVRYGDGSSIDKAELDAIRAAFKAEERIFNWQCGDVLILDNMLTCHGRTAYKGTREVLTAMCNRFA